jgi:hypothetical protein
MQLLHDQERILQVLQHMMGLNYIKLTIVKWIGKDVEVMDEIRSDRG